jgi:ubiquinone/menaquinone biosynthesis C-methylase UbiE
MIVLERTLVLFALWLAPVASFLQQDNCLRNTGGQRFAKLAPDEPNGGDGDGCDSSTGKEPQIGTKFADSLASRRTVLSRAASMGVVGPAVTAAAVGGGCCCCCSPEPALALAQITAPPLEQSKLYDLPRNAFKDAAFAQGMAVGMVDYERAAYPTKQKLFKSLFSSLENKPEPVLVEIGIGSFPNALYYTPRMKGRGGLDILGVDPNDRMEGYALDNASRAGLKNNGDGGTSSNTLRIVHGVSEALPLEDNSCDAVVCSLTLCSVVDPQRSVAEIKRVLKPGGKFLFWEHVLSETDPVLGMQQIAATPMQVQRADGCHLDRRTGETIRQAGFQTVDMNYLELKDFGFLNPTVCGIATA